MSRGVEVAALGAIVLAGALLRATALDFGRGVPEARPDESGVLVALGAYGAPPAPVVVLYGGGYFQPLRAFLAAAGLDPRPRPGEPPSFSLRVGARAWSAVLGTATVALTGVAAWWLAGPAAGLLAAALLAVCPLAVREAHFAKADTAASFAAALLVLALVASAGRPGGRPLAVGAAGGLALATKLCVGLLPATVLALLGAGPWRAPAWRRLALGSAALAAVFLVLDPFWLTAPAATWSLARTLAHAVGDASWLPGADGVPGPLRYHATVSLGSGCGLGLALLALPALVWGLARGGGPRLVAVAVLGHWATLLASTMVLARFVLPALPGLVVLAALLVDATVGRRALALAVAGALLVAAPLWRSATLVRLLGRTDTRALAAEWIAGHVPPDAPIVVWGAPPGVADFGVPSLDRRPALHRLAPERWAASGARWLVWHHYPLPYSSEPLPAAAATLAPAATFTSLDPEAAPVLEPLDAFYLPLAGLRGVERPGPRIEIFSLPAP